MTRAAKKEKAPVAKPEPRDPVRRALDAAPFDDEPLTASDKRAIVRGRRGPYLFLARVRFGHFPSLVAVLAVLVADCGGSVAPQRATTLERAGAMTPATNPPTATTPERAAVTPSAADTATTASPERAAEPTPRPAQAEVVGAHDRAPPSDGLPFVTFRRAIVTVSHAHEPVTGPIELALDELGDERGESVRVIACGPRPLHGCAVYDRWTSESRGLRVPSLLHWGDHTSDACGQRGRSRQRDYVVTEVAPTGDVPCEGMTHVLEMLTASREGAATVHGTRRRIQLWVEEPGDLSGARFVVEQRVLDPAVTESEWNAFFEAQRRPAGYRPGGGFAGPEPPPSRVADVW